MNTILEYLIFGTFGAALLIGIIIIIRNAFKIRGSVNLVHHKLDEQNQILSDLNLNVKEQANLSKINNSVPEKSSTPTRISKQQAN